MITFRARLTRALALSTAAFLSLFCLALYFWCRSAFLADLDGDLEAIFRADFAALEPGVGSDHSHQAGKPAQFGEFEVFKLLVDLDGRILESTAASGFQPDLSPNLLRRISREGPRFSNLSSGTGSFRILSSPVQVKGTTLIEVLGISQEPMLESLEELQRALGLSLLLGIGLVILVSNRVAGYLTGPLEGILEQLDSVTSQGDPALRITGSYPDSEMASLQRQLNAMLERLDLGFRVRKQFVSNASHELRAPLANLTVAIEVCLRRARTPEEYREVLQTCHGEAQRLNQMANQLLTLSKSDEGALQLQPEPTPLRALLEESLARHQGRASSKELGLRLDSPEVTVEVDPIKFSQVFDNLLDNAIRHSPAGSSVEVSAATDDGLLSVEIRDHGPGMSPEQMSRLFERFYRADPSRQRGTGGAGLGLSISQALVEAHGGKILVRSQPGQGTAVVIRLPLRDSLAPACSPTPAPS